MSTTVPAPCSARPRDRFHSCRSTSTTTATSSPPPTSRAPSVLVSGTATGDGGVLVLSRRLARWLDSRLGAAGFARTALNKVFPDHWSFMIGELALYCFIV